MRIVNLTEETRKNILKDLLKEAQAILDLMQIQ